MTDRAIPMLVSLNPRKTWKFWRYFGFQLVSPQEPVLDDAYSLILRRGEVQLYFDRTDRDFTSAEFLTFSRSCVIEVDDFPAWRAAFAHSRMGWKMFYPRLSEVTEHHWGRPAFCAVDRDANLVWIVERRDEPLSVD